jgi:hypothetical protein
MRRRHQHHFSISALQSHSSDNDAELSELQDEGQLLRLEAHRQLRRILVVPTTRSAFLNFIGDQKGIDSTITEQAIVRVRLWAKIRDYKWALESLRLPKAHFIWQTYLSDTAYERADLPPDMIRQVKSVVWSDEEGLDTAKLLNYVTFNSIE